MNGYVHGRRSRGRPKKRWIDVIRDDCKKINADLTCTPLLTWRMTPRHWRKPVKELVGG